MTAAAKPVRGRRIPTKNIPGWMEPMLATLVVDLLDSKGWVFERKLDGIRVLAYKDGEQVRLYSRNKLPLDDAYPKVVAALETLPHERFVLDGEATAYVDGDAAGFEALQQGRASIRYYVFDVLSLDGRDLRKLPLTERKTILRGMGLRAPIVRTTAKTGDAETLRHAACEAGWEGLIAKRADSPYGAGRSRDWLKLKCVVEQEFVVAGFTDPKGSRMGFGALLIGYHDDESGLRFAGEVGTGFNNAMLAELSGRLRATETDASPFVDLLRPKKGMHFVRPELVAQVGFTEWTRDGKLRHPRFLGLRQDKSPFEVVRERPT